MIKKVWNLVQEGARLRFLALLCLVCVGGLVELLGIVTTANLMGLVATQGNGLSKGPLALMLSYAEVVDPVLRMKYGLILSIGILAFVHGYTMVRTYVRAQFVWIQDKEISTRLFRSCLNRPYGWFLQQNSGELQRLLSSGSVVQSLLGSFVETVGQIAVGSTLLLALIVNDPTIALVGFAVVCVAYSLVRVFTRKTLEDRGRKAHGADSKRRVVAQEALTSIRFVKTTASEDFFVDEYLRQTTIASEGMVFHSIYVDTVRAFLEWVTFAGILSLSVYLVMKSDDIDSLLPSLTLYSMAGYRIIPAIHQVFSLWSRLKFDTKMVSDLEELMEFETPIQVGAARSVTGLDSAATLLSLSEVSFRYQGSERDVLQQVNLQIERGEWIGLVGTTGAGKTTLLDIISGLVVPTQGEVRVVDNALTSELVQSWQSHIGVVPQEVILLDDTIARNVAFGTQVEEIDEEFVLQVCQMAGLSELLSQLPDKLNTRLGERGTRLSGGERQRVGIARALYRRPSLLLLDEATSALDTVTEQRIVETLNDLAQGCTLVTIAHRLSSVRPCDRILLLEQGVIVAEGTFEDLLGRSEQFRNLAQSA